MLCKLALVIVICELKLELKEFQGFWPKRIWLVDFILNTKKHMFLMLYKYIMPCDTDDALLGNVGRLPNAIICIQ